MCVTGGYLLYYALLIYQCINQVRLPIIIEKKHLTK